MARGSVVLDVTRKLVLTHIVPCHTQAVRDELGLGMLILIRTHKG
jgi:hypothetical protein